MSRTLGPLAPAPAISVAPVSVILYSPNDWDEWHEVLRVKAHGLRVWEYIDDNRTTDLVEPVEPTPNDIKESETTTPTPFSGLDADQIEEYRNR
jgi:hypothetical protein